MAVTITFASNGTDKVWTPSAAIVTKVIAALEHGREDGEDNLDLFLRWFKEQCRMLDYQHRSRTASSAVEADDSILE